jgi:23S rRNA (pseudouridine1915-N3)-methyltransferase
MHWKIITVGKPGHKWVQQALDLYLTRLRHYTRLEHVIIKEAPLAQVEAQIMKICQGGLTILLDERGAGMRSVELARWIENEEVMGRKQVCLVIGGASGHSPALRESVSHLWCLSSFTLQHDLALLVVLEQVYRAYSINRGEPYHRE